MKFILVGVPQFVVVKIGRTVVAPRDKVSVVEGIIVLFVLFVSVEPNVGTYGTFIVVVLWIVLFHVITKPHLLGKVFSATDASLVDVLGSPSAIFVLPHVLYQVDTFPAFWSMLPQGKVLATELTDKSTSWMCLYPVINQFVGAFAEEPLLAISTFPFHVCI